MHFPLGSGSSTYAQIFNYCKLKKKKIEDGTFGLPSSELLWEGGPPLDYFLLGDDAFTLKPWEVKPYSRRQLSREDKIANYRKSSGRSVVEIAFGILVGRFRVLLNTLGSKPKVVRDIVLKWVALCNILRTHQGGRAHA